MQLVFSIAALAVVLVGVKLAAAVVVPIVLATFLAIVFQPLGARISKRGLPAVVTAIITVAAVVATVAFAGAILLVTVPDIAAAVPRYQAVVFGWRDSAAAALDAQQLGAAATAVRDLEPGRYATDLVAGSAATLGGMLQTLALVVLLTVFIQLEANTFPARLRRMLGSASRSRESIEQTIDALGDIQHYVRLKLLLSGARAVLIGGVCAALGVDHALLWGALAFSFNFIPVLGPLAASTPAVLAAAIDHGAGLALVLGIALLLINVAFGALVEPRLLGRAVGLSPLIVILAITLWGFVLGPVGALLAVPLTMVVKAVLAHSSQLSWLARALEYRALPTLASRPVPSAP